MGGKAALVVVIGFSIILGLVIRNLSLVSVRAQGNMGTYAANSESHNLAITGANAGLARLYQDTLWRGTESQDLTEAFRGSFTYTIIDGATGLPVLKSVSSVRGPDEMLHDTIIVVFGSNAMQSFTLFAWMTNLENGVYWITGDTVWGRVHSNDQLWVNGSPTYMEKVTTAKGFVEPWGTGTNHAIFKNDYETGVGRITFPSDLSQITAAATSGGRSFTGDVTVTMNGGSAANGDGYLLVHNSSGVLVDSVNLADPSFNGVVGASGRVSVSGTLDGKLSIFSTNSLYITDNILYENRTTSSDDVLGLVSENNIVIADNTPNATDVYIDGSVFSRSGSFTAENYSSGTTRGNIYLKGSIVQHKRGPVGTFSGSTIKTGYLKRYRYDQRLADNAFRPPFYPGFVSIAYPIASWWESVRIPKFQ